MMQRKTAFISDFDGTLTDDDFFNYAVNAYLDDEAMAPWRAYLAGKKTHFNALKEIFAQIHADTEELDRLISSIRVDAAAVKVWQLCNEKNIPLYICSAGCDYYIKRLIGNEIKEYGIHLVANEGTYDRRNGLVMRPPAPDSPFYDENIGISKVKVVEKLKKEGYAVIFAGDGPPDITPAASADVVFARKILLQKCREAGIKTEPFSSFADIYNYIKEL